MVTKRNSTMYSAFDHETQELYSEYVETRATTSEGWLRLFHKCYPDKARGVGMWTVDFNPDGVEILNHKGEVQITFERVP